MNLSVVYFSGSEEENELGNTLGSEFSEHILDLIAIELQALSPIVILACR